MVKAVFFDLDGTLLDTAPAFYQLLNQQLKEAGKAPVSIAALRTVVSDGAAAMVKLAFDIDEQDPQFQQQLDTLLTRYKANPAENTQLFDGMYEVLDTLEEAEIPWGIVTNKPERFTVPILEHLGLANRTEAVICPDHVEERKPSPEGLLKAAQILGVGAPQSCYVGDHLRDIEAGRNANMATIAVTYGYLKDDENPASWGADAYAHSPLEILARLGLTADNSESAEESE